MFVGKQSKWTSASILNSFRDLSEISRGGGGWKQRGVETEGGSQLFEPQKKEGS